MDGLPACGFCHTLCAERWFTVGLRLNLLTFTPDELNSTCTALSLLFTNRSRVVDSTYDCVTPHTCHGGLLCGCLLRRTDSPPAYPYLFLLTAVLLPGGANTYQRYTTLRVNCLVDVRLVERLGYSRFGPAIRWTLHGRALWLPPQCRLQRTHAHSDLTILFPPPPRAWMPYCTRMQRLHPGLMPFHTCYTVPRRCLAVATKPPPFCIFLWMTVEPDPTTTAVLDSAVVSISERRSVPRRALGLALYFLRAVERCTGLPLNGRAVAWIPHRWTSFTACSFAHWRTFTTYYTWTVATPSTPRLPRWPLHPTICVVHSFWLGA